MNNQRTTKQFSEKIISMYSDGKSSLQIAKKFKFNKKSILQCLKRNGILRRSISEAKRKYKINENYFEIIDIEEKAYFLGFLCADGYNQTERGIISIGLQKRDGYILEKFKECLGYNGPLYNIKPKKRKRKKQLRLTISCKRMSRDLENLGCVNVKSYNLNDIKGVPDHLMHHFIRGYFDGDGSVPKSSIKLPKITIVSTDKFCLFIKKFVESKININVQILKYKRHKKNTKVIEISGRNQSCIFMDWIYKDATYFLVRKFKRYIGLKFKKVDNRGRKYFNTEIPININLYNSIFPKTNVHNI